MVRYGRFSFIETANLKNKFAKADSKRVMKEEAILQEKALEGVNWFVGNTFSGADVQLSFIAEIAPMMYTVDNLPNLMAFRNRCHQRPAYQRGIAKTDFYAYGPKD